MENIDRIQELFDFLGFIVLMGIFCIGTGVFFWLLLAASRAYDKQAKHKALLKRIRNDFNNSKR